MTLADELMELQNAEAFNSGEILHEGEDHDDPSLAFDEVDRSDNSQGEHENDDRTRNLEDIFLASGFRRGMRQMKKELVHSKGDTDLASF